MRHLARLVGLTVAVPSPEDTAAFLVAGLEFDAEKGEEGAQHLSVEGDYGLTPTRRVLSLEPGEALGLREVRFEVRSNGLADLRSHVEGRGVEVEELPPQGDDGSGFVLTDPDGIRVACRDGHARREALPPSAIRPRRLGHVNLKVPNAGEAARFYQETLGLRLSEQVGDLLFFLRVGTDHHNLGFRGGAVRAGVHHVAFELPGWESYRVICDHLASLGHRVEYGPGRHGPGHNLFTYVVDPSSGLRVELFADMAHISDEDAYVPIKWQTLDRARTVNVWGPGPPESFLD